MNVSGQVGGILSRPDGHCLVIASRSVSTGTGMWRRATPMLGYYPVLERYGVRDRLTPTEELADINVFRHADGFNISANSH